MLGVLICPEALLDLQFVASVQVRPAQLALRDLACRSTGLPPGSFGYNPPQTVLVSV